MPLDRNSKLMEIWRLPVGRDLLMILTRQLGHGEEWARKRLATRMKVRVLEKLAGPEYVDFLLDAVNQAPAQPSLPQGDTAPIWWKAAVGYQIFLPSFMDGDHDGVGDVAGAVQRLPYLEGLGVDLLWLVSSESVPCPGGFDATLGGASPELAAMNALIKGAHARGMRVVLGLDIASTGLDHPWFQAAAGGDDDARSLYYFFEGSSSMPPNNWRRGKSPAWKWMPGVNAWALQLSASGRLDLNWNNPEVAKGIQSLLSFWLDSGVDGLFLGDISLLSKRGFDDGVFFPDGALAACGAERYAFGPGLHAILRQLRGSLPAGEDEQPPFLAGSAFCVGTASVKEATAPASGELDMLLDNGPVNSRTGVPEAEGALSFAAMRSYYLQRMQTYQPDFWMPLLLENSDSPRILSRLGASPVYRTTLAKLLAMLQLTLRGTPLIYQGAELGLANTRFGDASEVQDEDSLCQYAENKIRFGEKAALDMLRRTAPDNARTPFPWSAGPNGGFTGAAPWMRMPDGIEHLNAAQQMGDASSVWSFYQRMIGLRRKSYALVYGSFKPVFLKNKKVLCYFRIHEGEKWYVELNLTGKEIPRPGRIDKHQRLELSNYSSPSRTLRPYEANLYHCG